MQEIAEIYDLNVNTVKVRMFRARATMMENYRKRLKGTRARGRKRDNRP